MLPQPFREVLGLPNIDSPRLAALYGIYDKHRAYGAEPIFAGTEYDALRIWLVSAYASSLGKVLVALYISSAPVEYVRHEPKRLDEIIPWGPRFYLGIVSHQLPP